jgi:hypothetical protein
MFSFGPNPTRAKKAWSSSTCLLYALQNAQVFGDFPSSRGELSKEQGKERGEEQDQGKEQVARSNGRREKMEQGAM